MERRIDLNALRTFVTIVELGGLAKAGRYLGMPKSTVSRHVAKLEEQLGLPLILRDQNGIEITSSGRRLYDSSRAGLDSLGGIRRLVAQSEPVSRGLVRIKSPTVFGRAFLGDIVSEFCQAFPEVSLRLDLSERIFEIDDEIDVAFCVGTIVPSDLEFWSLGSVEAKLYAAPAFLAAKSIEVPTDLNALPLLTPPCGSAHLDRWSLRTHSGKVHSFSFMPRLESNETDILLAAARSGLGVARLATFAAAPYCARGELAPVLPDWHIDNFDVQLAARRKIRTQAVDTFIEFSRTRLRDQIDF